MVALTGNCTDYNSSTDCTCTKSEGNYLSSHYDVCAVLYVNHDKIILEFCHFSVEAIEWAFRYLLSQFFYTYFTGKI